MSLPIVGFRMAKSQQSQFGDIQVFKVSSDLLIGTDEPQCDKVIGWEDQEPVRCSNSATIGIIGHSNLPEFYCLTHSKDTWKELAGVIE